MSWLPRVVEVTRERVHAGEPLTQHNPSCSPWRTSSRRGMDYLGAMQGFALVYALVARAHTDRGSAH